MKQAKKLIILLTLTTLVLAGCDSFKSKCGTCDGTGKVKCITCSGTGKSNCTWCFGAGKKYCSQCNGMGSKYQNIYVGYMYKDGYQLVNAGGFSGYAQVIGGSINVNVPCQTCNRTGSVKCSNISCEDGKVKCTMCYGTGQQTCSVCNGTGKN